MTQHVIPAFVLVVWAVRYVTAVTANYGWNMRFKLWFGMSGTYRT